MMENWCDSLQRHFSKCEKDLERDLVHFEHEILAWPKKLIFFECGVGILIIILLLSVARFLVGRNTITIKRYCACLFCCLSFLGIYEWRNGSYPVLLREVRWYKDKVRGELNKVNQLETLMKQSSQKTVLNIYKYHFGFKKKCVDELCGSEYDPVKLKNKDSGCKCLDMFGGFWEQVEKRRKLMAGIDQLARNKKRKLGNGASCDMHHDVDCGNKICHVLSVCGLKQLYCCGFSPGICGYKKDNEQKHQITGELYIDEAQEVAALESGVRSYDSCEYEGVTAKIWGS